IDVVMRRRRNQTDTRNRMAKTRDDVVDLMPGELAAFARFRALCHLDLKLVSVDQVIRRYSETRGGNLFDGTSPQITIGIGLEALFVFAAFASVRLTSDAVHGDRESLVRFLADRTERHGSGREALDNFLGGL